MVIKRAWFVSGVIQLLRKQGRALCEPPQSVCSINSFIANIPALERLLLYKITLMCTATRSSCPVI